MKSADGFWPLVLALSLMAPATLVSSEEPSQSDDAMLIIDKSLKAGGGVAKIGKFSAVCVKGTCSGKDVDAFSFAASFEGPNRIQLVIDPTHDQKKKIMVVNGDRCWTKEGDEDAREMKKKDLALMSDFLHAMCLPDQLMKLHGNGYTVSPLAGEKIAGKDTVGVLITHKDHREVRLFFDKTTWLPVGSKVKIFYYVTGKDEWCEFHTSEYKDIDGVKHFTHLKVRIADEKYGLDFAIKEITLHENLDSAIFQEP